MRRWIAAALLVPAVAWGQGSACYSVEAHDMFAEMASMVERGYAGGVGERELYAFYDNEPAPVRAAWHAAIGHTYRESGMSLSAIISSMQAACVREDYASRSQ